MKLKWKKLCAAALAVTMAMGNLTYGAPLENARASARALSAAKIEGLYRDNTDESGTEELLKDGLVMHSTFDEGRYSRSDHGCYRKRKQWNRDRSTRI